ncbi:MAG: CapA family protein [Acidimicrobiales bacterium]|nr:CapA family protein [Acidimicrobiales bacterium]
MIRPQLDANPGGMLSAIAPVLGQADVAVVNLETAITTGGTPAPKTYVFRAPPSAFTALAAAGVDVASMANNHGMDFGTDGLRDSLAASQQAGLPVIGIGEDAARAYAPHVVDVRGQRIAIIGATQVLDDNLISAWTAGEGKPGVASAKEVDRLVGEVQAARQQADTVVVFLHWGIEKDTCPSAAQQELAQTLADAGADVIVGGHAHRLQGAGRLGQAFVAYGLGNFVFYTPSGPGTNSGVLLLTVRGRSVESYRWEPAVISNGVPVPLQGGAADQARASWDQLRSCTNLTP